MLNIRQNVFKVNNKIIDVSFKQIQNNIQYINVKPLLIPLSMYCKSTDWFLYDGNIGH